MQGVGCRIESWVDDPTREFEVPGNLVTRSHFGKSHGECVTRTYRGRKSETVRGTSLEAVTVGKLPSKIVNAACHPSQSRVAGVSKKLDVGARADITYPAIQYYMLKHVS